MINKKEIIAILISAVLMALIISFINRALMPLQFILGLLISLIIIATSVFAKKITAKKIDIAIEVKPWTFQRYWITRTSYFKKPISIGLILPIILAFLSEGTIKFFAFLEFESRALPSKVTKQYGRKRYSSVLEWDDALIGFYSLVGVLLLGVISSFIGFAFFKDLSRYALIYSISNLMPISKLEGTKIFFGSRPLYTFSWVLLVLAGLVMYVNY